MGKKNQKRRWPLYARYLGFALSFGTTMTLAILLGLFGGRWVDQKLNTGPLFMIFGFLVGTGLGFYVLWSELAVLQRLKNRRREDSPDEENTEGNRGA